MCLLLQCTRPVKSLSVCLHMHGEKWSLALKMSCYTGFLPAQNDMGTGCLVPCVFSAPFVIREGNVCNQNVQEP